MDMHPLKSDSENEIEKVHDAQQKDILETRPEQNKKYVALVLVTKSNKADKALSQALAHFHATADKDRHLSRLGSKTVCAVIMIQEHRLLRDTDYEEAKQVELTGTPKHTLNQSFITAYLRTYSNSDTKKCYITKFGNHFFEIGEPFGLHDFGVDIKYSGQMKVLEKYKCINKILHDPNIEQNVLKDNIKLTDISKWCIKPMDLIQIKLLKQGLINVDLDKSRVAAADPHTKVKHA